MKKIAVLLSILLLLTGCGAAKRNEEEENKDRKQFTMPAEDSRHEGTWLNWPHSYTYGLEYRQEIEPVWVTMTKALHKGENVHIVVYDEQEKSRVGKLLSENGVDMEKIDFVAAKSNDIWSRDTGPIFVLDEQGKLAIADFSFDGWGEKTPFEDDDKIPRIVANVKNIPWIDLSELVLEGGSVELDGHKTAMLCKSSVVSENRNPDKRVEDVEAYLTQYFGAVNFIWLEGVTGEDITDGHIDGIARFYNENTILTVSEQDFFELYEQVNENDYKTLHTAKNADGVPYKIIELPLTAKNVGNLGYKGNYLNYYVGNEVVLLPVYQDENDSKAIQIVAELYAGRKIVPIDMTALYPYGGMLHCITQQQPEE